MKDYQQLSETDNQFWGMKFSAIESTLQLTDKTESQENGD